MDPVLAGEVVLAAAVELPREGLLGLFTNQGRRIIHDRGSKADVQIIVNKASLVPASFVDSKP